MMYVSVVRKTTTKQPVVAIPINVSARKTVLVAIAAQIQVAVNNLYKLCTNHVFCLLILKAGP